MKRLILAPYLVFIFRAVSGQGGLAGRGGQDYRVVELLIPLPRLKQPVFVLLCLYFVLILLIIGVVLHGLAWHEDHPLNQFDSLLLILRVFRVLYIQIMRNIDLIVFFGTRRTLSFGVNLGTEFFEEGHLHLIPLLTLPLPLLLLIKLLLGLHLLFQLLEGIACLQEILPNQRWLYQQLLARIRLEFDALPLCPLLFRFLFTIVFLEYLHLPPHQLLNRLLPHPHNIINLLPQLKCHLPLLCLPVVTANILLGEAGSQVVAAKAKEGKRMKKVAFILKWVFYEVDRFFE